MERPDAKTLCTHFPHLFARLSPGSSLKLRFGDFGGNFFGEVIHSHYVRMEKAL
jgi:hypothetical protein